MFPFLSSPCLDEKVPVRADYAADIVQLVGSESATPSEADRIEPALGLSACLGDMNVRPLIEVVS